MSSPRALLPDAAPNHAQLTSTAHAQPQMMGKQPWADYPLTFRAREMHTIASWLTTNSSGSLLGPDGVGKSDFIGFLCNRPDALAHYLPPDFEAVTLLALDLNTLPARSLSALYRVMLRTFYEARHRFTPEHGTLIEQLYIENRTAADPFLAQSALRELLAHFQATEARIVIVLDRFDTVCRMLTPEMSDSLRGLRDSFKRTLSYIACLREGHIYLPHSEVLGDLYRLLDAHTCYLGPLTADDAAATIWRRIGRLPRLPNDAEVAHLVALTGGYPALLRVALHWWFTLAQPLLAEEWQAELFALAAIRRRLEGIWRGLTQEEQMVLVAVQQGKNVAETSHLQRYDQAARALVEKGLCLITTTGLQIFCPLFAEHVAAVGWLSRGRIWCQPLTAQLYQGEQVIEGLTPRETVALRHLVAHPHLQHTYTDLIVAIWSEEERYHGVSNDSLYQLMRGLRLKIEPVPAQPVYIVNWRGRPEGGYQFFPEGRPQ